MIRKVRNECAHCAERMHFTEPDIRDRISAISGKQLQPPEVREQFLVVVRRLISAIARHTSQTSHAITRFSEEVDAAIESVDPSGESLVTAESLYEAALAGLKAISETWAEEPGMNTPISVSIVPVEHQVTLRQIRTWVESNPKSPKEIAQKTRLKELLPGSEA